MALFQKGQSGNPNGRPKMDPEVRDFARAKSLAAIQRIASFIDHEDPDIAMKACNSILDRAWGKPTQPVAGDDEMPAVKVESIVLRGVDP